MYSANKASLKSCLLDLYEPCPSARAKSFGFLSLALNCSLTGVLLEVKLSGIVVAAVAMSAAGAAILPVESVVVLGLSLLVSAALLLQRVVHLLPLLVLGRGEDLGIVQLIHKTPGLKYLVTFA